MNDLTKYLIASLLLENEDINELQPSEIKYWALHADIFDALKKDSDYKRVYIYLKNKLTGERLKALEYFYNEYFLNPKTPIKESLNETSSAFNEAVKSLTKYMVDQGMNIKPLPHVITISNDSKNASNILGKTAHYNPSNCSITLYTLNRHPKDILRSYAHEMIHRIQDNEGRLKNITTTNTNEDRNLEELEKEAYLQGNMCFRNWEDSLKNNINEWIVDIPKFNQPKTFIDNLRESLHEIVLSKNNAVETYGDLTGGKFQVGDIIYEYSIKNIPNPYNDLGAFYNVQFTPRENITSTPQGRKENYIKILSTMYKIILDFTEEVEPEYIGISSLDNKENKNYHTVYANLTDNKFNRIPGYFRKDVNLSFDTPQGKGRMVVLKRKDV